MDDILKLLEKDGTLTAEKLAPMLQMSAADVTAAIKKYEEDKVILGYQAVIDWDRAGSDWVTALIEIKIAPQRAVGFDRIAERIYQYEQVQGLYLMSGAFDLTAILVDRSIRSIAEFVFAKLAPIDGVTSTATHFILKKYKDKNIMFAHEPEQEERLLFV